MRIGIFGSSGMAREVADICVELGYTNIFYIEKKKGVEQYSGYEIISEDEINELAHIECSYVIGIGDSKIRRKIVDRFSHLNFVNVIHPSAIISDELENKFSKQKGNIIGAGVIFTNNIQMGDFNIVNIGSTISHDCIIANFVTISPGVNIAGNVHVDEGASIGIGAKIINGKSIDQKVYLGENSIVGAGAVVVNNVPPNVVVKGIPAR